MITTTKNATAAGEQAFDADAYVADFLRESPDFLARNPQLLMEIDVPHHQQGAVSLVERQVLVQRDRYNALQQQLNDIVEVAHQNDNLSELLHDYSVGLMSAGSLDEVFNFTKTIMQKRLKCEMTSAIIRRNDVVEACLDGLTDYVTLVDDQLCESMADLHTRRSVYCGYPVSNRVEQFFPDSGNEIKSIAIIRLADASSVQPIKSNYRHAVTGKPFAESKGFGYLAMASTTRERFSPSMGTDFLSRFGALLSARLAAFY